MTILPMAMRLKRRVHRDMAQAQDLMIIGIYNNFPGAVVHGGTAIWRCYGSGRFSEDIDVYLPKKFKKSENMKSFLDDLRGKGFIPIKFREKENSIFSVFTFQNVTVRFEAVFEDKRNFMAKPFEMSDGTFISVYTFSPEELIKEKISAYLKRRKVRDLYDIYFLLKFAEKGENLKSALNTLLKSFKEPVDTETLKALIISGAVPDVKSMLGEMERWAR